MPDWFLKINCTAIKLILMCLDVIEDNYSAIKINYNLKSKFVYCEFKCKLFYMYFSFNKISF